MNIGAIYFWGLGFEHNCVCEEYPYICGTSEVEDYN